MLLFLILTYLYIIVILVVLESVLELPEDIQPEVNNLNKYIAGGELNDWNRQIARDAASGKFDRLVEDALEAHTLGQ